MIPWPIHALTIFLTLSIAFLIIVALRPRFYVISVPPLTFWVPFITHLYVLAAGLISGVILDPPFLLLVGVVMMAIALYLHLPTVHKIFASLTSLKPRSFT